MQTASTGAGLIDKNELHRTCVTGECVSKLGTLFCRFVIPVIVTSRCTKASSTLFTNTQGINLINRELQDRLPCLTSEGP